MISSTVYDTLCHVQNSGATPTYSDDNDNNNNTSRAARGGGGSFKNRKRIGEIGCCESRMTKRTHTDGSD